MAIILQLSSASPKAVSSGTTASPAAAMASEDDAQGQPFALMMDGLLKPVGQEPSVAEDAAPSELAGGASASIESSTDAATQALLASLLLNQSNVPQVPPPAATAATELPERAGSTLPQSLPLSMSMMDEQTSSTKPSLPPLATAEGAANTASFAFALAPDAAAGDKKLPEAAAKLAAPVVDVRLVQNVLADLDTGELPAGTVAQDVGQLRPSASLPAAPLAATGPVTVAQYSIPEPVAGNRWADALGQRALFMVDQQVKSAELHLNPPNLGPLEVKLALDGDKASLSFTTNQAAVREAVQQALPRLHQVFADNGMAGLNVQVHLGQQQQPQQQERSMAENGQGDSGSGVQGTEDRLSSIQSARWHSQSYATARGGVDVFA